MSLTRLAHSLVSEHFSQQTSQATNQLTNQSNKRLAIDATCGNGNDTEFLARQDFEKVLGFDVQAIAIDNTRKRIESAGFNHVLLHQHGHQNLADYVDGKIDCAMFNFGYLPRADKSITTQSESSLKGLNAALQHLHDNGLICLICYPGHIEGAIETNDIRHWFTQLDDHWQIKEYNADSPKPEAPVLFTITRRNG